MWQAVPAYLSHKIERVQKRALHITYPEEESYGHALQLGEIHSLDKRREPLSNKHMTQMKSPNHSLHHLLHCTLLNEYNLKRNS